jgi:hypothetical protein
MNTVQRKTTTVIRYELTMNGPITARDIGDFVQQVNAQFEQIKGHPVMHDDDYYVTGDGESITAFFEARGPNDHQ